jgi:SPX domain protein involved in polyphosphate accumulation
MINLNDLKFEDARCEKKFVICDLDMYETENLIKFHPLSFSEIFEERIVNNIYLDSVDLKNYRDNLAGVSDRLKIRIRWYGKLSEEIKDPVLELKFKHNELGWKHSFRLIDFTLNNDFTSEFMLNDIFLKSDVPKWLLDKLKLFVPTLLNSYNRKYFISSDGKFRVTLDDDQRYFGIGGKNNSFLKKFIENEEIVFELKCSNLDYHNADPITQHFPFRLSANSKYVRGINLLDDN